MLSNVFDTLICNSFLVQKAGNCQDWFGKLMNVKGEGKGGKSSIQMKISYPKTISTTTDPDPCVKRV